jgi:YD repeat-containing protein
LPRRLTRVEDVDGTVTHYVYDTQYRAIEERDESDVLLARYTYGQGMDEPLTMEVISGAITVTYYYHRDAPSMNSGQGWAASPRSRTGAARSSSATSTMPSAAR